MDGASDAPFGYLLALDVHGCKAGACDDLDLCYRFLEELVAVLQMKKQSPPFLFKSDQVEYPDKAGLSGWIPLIESGIQIHTLSRDGFISVDVYSCRRFDVEAVKTLATRFFGSTDMEQNFILRGTRFRQNA